MATATMSYNSDIPPPLPPARNPNKQPNVATLSRRPLPDLPNSTTVPRMSGRPLPEVPGEHPTSPHRSKSLPQNHFSPPPTQPHNEGRSLQKFHYHSVESRHPSTTSPPPPNLPPRRNSVDTAHQHQAHVVPKSPTSPPVPPRLNSLEHHRNGHANNGHAISSSHEFEARFHFHRMEDFPAPEEFSNKPKIYQSKPQNTKANRKKRAQEDLPAV